MRRAYAPGVQAGNESRGGPAGGFPPPPPPPPPGSTAPARRVWPWIVGGLAVVGALIAVRSVGGGSSDPTGRPTAAVDSFTPRIMVAPSPLMPDSPTVYDLGVDFTVTNGASAPIVVQSVETGLIGDPETRIVAYGGSHGTVAPGATATVHGSTQVVESMAGSPFPTPDSGAVVLVATWADDGDAACDI